MIRSIATAAALAAGLATSALAEGEVHRVAIHVDENDPQVMNMALNNVANVQAHYESIGDEVIVEVVAYGPGLNMFVAGKSPVEDRISAMALEMDNLSFAACGNTHRNMSAKAGAEVPLISEAGIVPSGVVRLIELQEEGYAYVRP
ncbi:DsrE family protein [Jannaschia ovalis]|uniref:DsrE family protein n=1 Tax=Jannaschia ovalis TaxID=3038773 RepID=A0ABY8LE78_9RHOB|nr:DsrE family protein [Jannaschia sp. GRR-S6-38]WGH79628.1 DsrE family protein [Jannaschia sp. GRR-S6-38]